jgi:predicted glutamine amidotransferase
MCIIFYNETGKTYNKEALSIAYDNNPHGVGLMWIEGSRLQTLRGLMSKEKMFETLGHFEGVPHALHLRWRTRGKIDKSLCHPFRASHKGAGSDVFMMHNGTFMDLTPPAGLSDTHMFAAKMQDVTQEYGTDMLFNESFLRRVEKNIKSFNKVIFLRNDGKVAIVNPESWTVMDGLWLSNTYSLEDGYRKRKTQKAYTVSSVQSNKGQGGKSVSSAQSGKARPAGDDWMAKSQAWEKARRASDGREANDPQLQEIYRLAYEQREDKLGRKLTKREMKKVRKTVRRDVKREKARASEERAAIQRKAFEAMVKDGKVPVRAEEAKPGRPGSVVRRRRKDDGTVETLPVRSNNQLN